MRAVKISLTISGISLKKSANFTEVNQLISTGKTDFIDQLQ